MLVSSKLHIGFTLRYSAAPARATRLQLLALLPSSPIVTFVSLKGTDVLAVTMHVFRYCVHSVPDP